MLNRRHFAFYFEEPEAPKGAPVVPDAKAARVAELEGILKSYEDEIKRLKEEKGKGAKGEIAKATAEDTAQALLEGVREIKEALKELKATKPDMPLPTISRQKWLPWSL